MANNMSRHMELSKAQISKITQSRKSFGSRLGNLGKKELTTIAISCARVNLPGLVCNLSSNVINKCKKNK